MLTLQNSSSDTNYPLGLPDQNRFFDATPMLNRLSRMQKNLGNGRVFSRLISRKRRLTSLLGLGGPFISVLVGAPVDARAIQRGLRGRENLYLCRAYYRD